VARTDLAAVQVAHRGRGPADLVALRRAEALATPDALAATRTLPVPACLTPLLPGGALQRGDTVGVTGPGATSLALALGSAASSAGSWLAVAGVPALGLSAVGELGVDLDRLLVVADPPVGSWATVVAALLDAVDVVVASPPSRLAAADARRLSARVRERGAVLCTLGDAWPQPADVRLTVTGPAGRGPPVGAVAASSPAASRSSPVAGGRRPGSGASRCGCPGPTVPSPPSPPRSAPAPAASAPTSPPTG
jgi:hypothetical protein